MGRRTGQTATTLAIMAVVLTVAAGCSADAQDAATADTVTVTATAPAPTSAPTTVTATKTVHVTSTVTAIVQPATQPPEPVTSVQIRGQYTQANAIDKSLDPSANCVTAGVVVEVLDGSGSVQALARLSPSHPTEVDSQPSFLSWTCTHRYTANVDGTSPVYRFRAYFEGLLDDYPPDERTAPVAQLRRGEAPSLFMSFCPTCS